MAFTYRIGSSLNANRRYPVIRQTNLASFRITLAVTLLLFSGSALAQNLEKITKAPAFSAEQLLAPPTDGWITNGGTLFNQRFSPLTQITMIMSATSRESGGYTWVPAWRPSIQAKPNP